MSTYNKNWWLTFQKEAMQCVVAPPDFSFLEKSEDVPVEQIVELNKKFRKHHKIWSSYFIWFSLSPILLCLNQFWRAKQIGFFLQNKEQLQEHVSTKGFSGHIILVYFLIFLHCFATPFLLIIDLFYIFKRYALWRENFILEASTGFLLQVNHGILTIFDTYFVAPLTDIHISYLFAPRKSSCLRGLLGCWGYYFLLSLVGVFSNQFWANIHLFFSGYSNMIQTFFLSPLYKYAIYFFPFFVLTLLWNSWYTLCNNRLAKAVITSPFQGFSDENKQRCLFIRESIITKQKYRRFYLVNIIFIVSVLFFTYFFLSSPEQEPLIFYNGKAQSLSFLSGKTAVLTQICIMYIVYLFLYVHITALIALYQKLFQKKIVLHEP